MNIINENNETPSYPVLDNNNNNKDNKGFAENLDWDKKDDNNIVLQNKQNFDNNNNQGIEIKNKEESSDINNNNARQIETNLDTLDESVCETIVIIINFFII